MIDVTKMEQGNIKSLFLNLGMVVYSCGCKCEVIGVNTNQVQLRVLENFNSGYKIGNIIWNDSFLIDKLSNNDLNKSMEKTIRDEMSLDMLNGCMPVGEIESCLNHWSNKYHISIK